MSGNNFSRNNFRKTLCSLAQHSPSKAEITNMSKQVMQAFLDFGSETPDNLDCFQNLEYGLATNDSHTSRKTVGLKLKGADVLISDVMHMIESMEIPAEVKEDFPDLTTEQWDAITRMTVMMLFSLEQDVK
jgi:hypothetical protein